MDEQTRRYYESNADEVARQQLSVPSPLSRYFGISFPRGARVLDLGAGAGRELAELVREGYDARGVEPAESLRNVAVVHSPEIRARLFAGALPRELPPASELGGPFDGIVCSAVLQHLPRADLFEAVFQIRSLLKERGRVLVSVPEAHGDVTEDRDAYGRLFNGVTPDELELLFERTGFASIGRWAAYDALGRTHVRWVTILLESRAAGAARQIDFIESVLSAREKKVATYKLALIRALCAIALTEPHVARFGIDGKVRVPIRAIAERWIDYYWPLFQSPRFLPQMNGEHKAGHHTVAFSSELASLIEYYGNKGQLTAFAVGRRGAELPTEAALLHRALVGKLQQTIRSGPVHYAGGSLESRMFGYENNQVLIAAPLWRELSLMGHWIQDALILRWAELVNRLAKDEVSVDLVVARLLEAPDAPREQSAAREVYEASDDLECVWTGRSLQQSTFHVDHAIPYSLWRNNDLWNLLPAHRAVNAEKSDSIPATALLRCRRDAIVHCWELTRSRLPHRFENEARAQLGGPGGASVDLARLFERLVESAEVTALQRACPRWHPSV